MTIYKLGLLEGDGIGPEIIESTVRLLNEITKKHEVKIEWIPLLVGWRAIEQKNDSLPEETIESLRNCHAWLLGPHDSASYPEKYKNIRNPSGELRHLFDLYSNIRPAKNLPNINSMVKNADLVIYRENTEGFYADRNMFKGVGEFQITKDVVITTGVFTRKAIERIAHAAFKKAMERRKKVTIVHKANVIRLGSGMFLNICKEVSEHYPEVIIEDYHIDAMCAHVVRRIEDFDVIIAENMFGDILSDLTGELIGSLGLAPSINSNENHAMAQAVHGSAPDIADENIANPIGMMLSTALLFEWMSYKYDDIKLTLISESIESSIHLTLNDGLKTKDLGGDKGTKEFTSEVIKRLDNDFINI